MGCDIHLFAEAKKNKTIYQRLKFWEKPKWRSIDIWVLDNDYDPPLLITPYGKRFYNGGGNYNLFAALCGVRSYHFKDETKMISEPRGIPNDTCKLIKRQVERWGSDGHSHNYNTLKELKDFQWTPYGDTVNAFLEEVLPKMEAVGVDEDSVRIVYFFDN